MPTNRMCALVCVYQNRPLESTIMTASMLLKGCTGEMSCVDCCYTANNVSFKVHAYWSNGSIFLLADDSNYSASFLIFKYKSLLK